MAPDAILYYGPYQTEFWEHVMFELDEQMAMELQSGISAFEAKYFGDASKLLSPLADAGHPEAQYRMAVMAQNGLGMVKNDGMALRYMTSAAEAGHALAQHGLGFMYMQGECVEQDASKALEWFQQAAEQGMVGSLTTMAMMYKDGIGVEQDLEEAQRLNREAGFDEF
jgi:hypothetical protein